MGTGAVYVTLSGIKNHSQGITVVETVFYFLNIVLFLLNSTTLLLQGICKRRLIGLECDAHFCFSVSPTGVASDQRSREGYICATHCTFAFGMM